MANPGHENNCDHKVLMTHPWGRWGKAVENYRYDL